MPLDVEKALNAPTTAVAFVFQNAASGVTTGFNGSGNAVFESFSVRTQDGQLVEENYTFEKLIDNEQSRVGIAYVCNKRGASWGSLNPFTSPPFKVVHDLLNNQLPLV
jgi:hypothetical protein